jgi:hypothetical protein
MLISQSQSSSLFSILSINQNQPFPVPGNPSATTPNPLKFCDPHDTPILHP